MGAPEFTITDEEGLLQILRANQPGAGVALDIDETLSWTVGWWMERMLQMFGNPEGLGPAEMAAKYHLCQNVPYWSGRPEVEEWMQAQRDNDELQRELPLVAHALECVKALHENVPVMAYITVRPLSVLPGTRAWLEKHGFPPAPIVGKPDDVAFAEGNAWKGALLPRLYPHVLGLVDDNPSVMRSVPLSYRGTVFLLGAGTDDVERPASGKDHRAPTCSYVACRDWRVALEAVGAALGPLLAAPAQPA